MVQIGVMSKNREYFPTSKLLEELDRRTNLSGVFLSTQYMNPFLSNVSSDTLFANQSLRSLAGVIPRIGRSQTEIGLLCLKQLELMGIPTTLSANALFLARDKFRCYQTLMNLPGIKIPKTILINHPYKFDSMMSRFRFPVVIKIPNATKGMGTILAPSSKVANEIVEALFLRHDSPIMVQEYLQRRARNDDKESMDIRVMVVGNTILGAMKRIAPKGEWRTNYAQGAECVPHKLISDEQELILKITNRLGIELAGIDLFPTQDEVYVLEVNACPGWKAFESVYPHISVATQIIDYLETKIRL